MPRTDVDPDRLSRIVAELGGKASYAFGDRRLSSPLTDEEAVAVAEAFSEEVDEGVAERARLAEAQRLSIHCHAGCTPCCNVVVMVYRPESARVAAFLDSPEGAEARAHFAAEYPRWRGGLADLLPRAEALSADHKDQRPYFELLVEGTRRRVLCAFNSEGRCAIYAVRPLGCRHAHALDTDERCVPDDLGRKAAALAFAPLDRLMVESSRLLRAVHNNVAGAPRHRAEALCQAVARRLGLEGGDPVE